MRFEKGRLVSDESVRRGVGLVEPVTAEFLDEREKFARQVLIDPVDGGPLHKAGLVLVHDVLLLLPMAFLNSSASARL